MTDKPCDCLYCEADRVGPTATEVINGKEVNLAEFLRTMATVYPGGPDCSRSTSEVTVTYGA